MKGGLTHKTADGALKCVFRTYWSVVEIICVVKGHSEPVLPVQKLDTSILLWTWD